MEKTILKNHFNGINFNLTMRLTVLLLLLSLFRIEASTYSQNTKITLKLNDVTIEKVFNEIEKQTDFNIFFNNSIIDLNRKISVNVNKTGIEKILDIIFFNTNIQYKVVKKQVILTEKPPVQKIIKQIPVSTKVIQNQIEITGNVTDEDRNPLPGVNIIIIGTTIGTETDLDGNYTINATKGDVLSFSYVGMETYKVTVGLINKINVILKADASSVLEEVVVVGYGTKKKINLSGAVGTVEAKTIENRPVSSVGVALQGTIGNLNITPGSGRATDAPSINVRGFGTLSGGGSPLILIDNVAISEREASGLNPNDIESVSVLKDAASAAIYGARAAFGVVLITTKSAKKGVSKPVININTFAMTKVIANVPKPITDPYINVYYKNIMAQPWYSLYDQAAHDEAKDRSLNPGNYPDAILKPGEEYWTYYGTTNWFDEVYSKSSYSQNVNGSVSGASEKVRYYFSGQYYKQEGALKYGNDVLDRLNLRSKIDIDLTSWLELNTNMSYVRSEYDEPVSGGWGFFHNTNRTNTLNIPKNPDGSWTSSGANLMGKLQDGGRSKSEDNVFQYTAGLKAKFLNNDLIVNLNYSARVGSNYTKAFQVPVEYKTGPEHYGYTNGGSSWVRESNGRSHYNVINAFVNYNKTLGDHQISGMVGASREYNQWGSNWLRKTGLLNTNLPSIGLAVDDPTVGTGSAEWAINSLFYRVGYIYKSRYIIELVNRHDSSSKFAEDRREAMSPSGSIAWIASKESFLGFMNPVVSHLKFRASYGILGNQNVGEYSYIPSMRTYTVSQILDGKQPLGINPPSLIDAGITWEEVRTANFGVDINFFKNRLTSSFDYYNRETIGMLTKGQSLPGVLGAAVPVQNAADLETKGFELAIGWNDSFELGNSPFNYAARIILSDNNTYITKFENDTGYLGDHYVGKELGEIWGLTNAPSFFQTQEEIDLHADQSAVTGYLGTRPIEPGDLKFEDLNGDGFVNWGDWTLDDHGDYSIIGNNRDHYSFSVDLSANWKGFDIRTFMQGVGKKDYYPGSGSHYFWGVYAQPWSNVYEAHLDNWTPENRNAYFPRLKSYTAEVGRDLGIAQTKYLQNAAYMRMKNLTIGYTIPQTTTKKAGIDRLRFYFSGENLFEVTELAKRLDPEALDGRVYPFQRSYAIGVNVSF